VPNGTVPNGTILLQAFAAMLAVVGVQVGLFVAAWASAVLAFLLSGVNHCGRYDTGGYGYDGVAQYHDYSGQELAQCGNRCDIAVSHCGKSDYCPVYAGRNAGKQSIWGAAFNNIHYGAQDAHQYHHEHEIDQNLDEALAYALQQQVALVQEREQLEHAEYAEQAEGSHQGQISERREEHAEQLGQGSHQVYYTKEAEHILTFYRRAIYP